jgi:hypothetical protein
VVLRASFVALVALAGLVAGCIHRAPVARLANPTPITLVVLADDAKGTHPDPAPALATELARRNLVVDTVPDAALASLGDTHDTRTRTELLAKTLGPGKLFMLVELRAEYFAQMEGKWKWNVSAQVTVARSDDLPHDTATLQHAAVFLDSESDGAPEAFAAAWPLMGDRLGHVVDDYFVAHAATSSPTPAPDPTPTPNPTPTAPTPTPNQSSRSSS